MFVEDEMQGDELNCRHETREDLLDITRTPKQLSERPRPSQRMYRWHEVDSVFEAEHVQPTCAGCIKPVIFFINFLKRGGATQNNEPNIFLICHHSSYIWASIIHRRPTNRHTDVSRH